MTQEEKAKAYDEALEQAQKELAACGNMDCDAARQIFRLFPQLRESEDEIARKWLVALVENLGEPADEDAEKELDEMRPLAIAYLEKQKEQIPYIDFVIKPHKGDDNNPYDMSVSKALEYAIDRGFGIPFNDGEVFVDERYMTQTIGNILRWADEHQKEQKPVQSEDEREYVRIIKSIVSDFIRDKKPEDVAYYQKIYDWLDGRHVEMKEQKPTSTKDMPYITDEHFYEREPADSFKYKLAEYMTKCCTKKEGPYGYTYGISAEAILKMAEEELLKRGVVQKLAEWSEEDKKACDGIIAILEAWDRSYTAPGGIQSVVPEYCLWLETRLKSLRPQPKKESVEEKIMNFFDAIGDCGFTQADILKLKSIWKECGLPSPQHHWKPNERQLNALNFAITYFMHETNYKNPTELRELYDDLLKLE